MDHPALPAVLHAFLFECIESYEQLEILMVLHAEPGRWWNLVDCARQVGIPESLALVALQELVRHRLVEVRGLQEYRYCPAMPELDYKTRVLVRHYRDQRLEIVKQMSANAIERLRTAALRAFADAFVIRRTEGTDAAKTNPAKTNNGKPGERAPGSEQPGSEQPGEAPTSPKHREGDDR